MQIAVGLLCLLVLCGGVLEAQPRGNEELDREALEELFLEELAAGRGTGDIGTRLAEQPTGIRRPPRPRSRIAEEASDALEALALAARSGSPVSLAEAFRAFEANDLLVRAELDRAQATLDHLGSPPELRQRLDAARAHYHKIRDRLFELLAEPSRERFRGGRDRRGESVRGAADRQLTLAAPEVLALLADLRPTPHEPILRASVLPYRRAGLGVRPPALAPAVVPTYLSALEVAPAAEDVEPTAAAPLATEIVDQAAALGHDYVRIFELVRNTIRTEWYSGGMKGALGTLRSGSGNDVDQASLLIALLRASNLAARYVHGVVRLPRDYFDSSLGFDDPSQISAFLSRAGIAHAPIIEGGAIRAFQVESTWVSVHVPYSNYRGAVLDFSGRTWLPLMPWHKEVGGSTPSRILEAMDFDTDGAVAAYLSTAQPDDPLAQIRRQVESFLQANRPGESFEDQLGTPQIVGRELGLLPSTLPVQVVAVTGEGAALGDAHSHRVRIVARATEADDSPAILDLTLPLSRLAGERVTLSYIPATVDDARLVNSWGGLSLVPAFLVELRPQLKIGGRQVKVGDAIPMAGRHLLELTFEGPQGEARVEQTLLAGAYHALVVGAQQALLKPMPEDDPGDTEFLGARLLAGLGYAYAGRWDAAEDTFAGLLDVELVRPLPSLTMVSTAMDTVSLFGLPQRLRFEGVTLDAALRVAEPVDGGGDSANERAFLRLSGLQGSALERFLFEEDFLVVSISTDKGLGLARDAGIEVLSVDGGNVDTLLPSLAAHPVAVRSEIENWARLGMTVEVPRTPLEHNAWSGSLWRVEDPASGAAGYFLSGGLAGGATSEDPADWILDFFEDALADPFSAGPNEDPLAGRFMFKLPATDGQEGIVGEEHDTPFAVQVLDERGVPVKGAEVQFFVLAGGGTLRGESAGGEVMGSSVTVLTDDFGFAAANLTPGERTEANPLFFFREAGDEFPTVTLHNVVEVTAATQFGPIFTGAPFETLAFPGEASRLTRTNGSGTNLGGTAAKWSDTIIVAVEDEFGNPISNVDVTFSAGAMDLEPSCTNAPEDPPQNTEFFEASVDDAGRLVSCPFANPVLGQCGEQPLRLKSRTFGTVAGGVVLGNVTYASYPVEVSARGLPSLNFTYNPVFFQFGEDKCGPWFIVRAETNGVLINSAGEVIHATKPGERFERPQDLAFFSFVAPITEVTVDEDGDVDIELNPATGEWREIVLDSAGQVNFEVSNGGSVAAPSLESVGSLSTFITTGPSPAANVVGFRVENLRQWVYDTRTEEVPLIPCPDEFFFLCGFTLSRDDINTVTAIDPKITEINPPEVVLTDESLSTSAIEITYNIPPASYIAGGISIDLFEDDTLIAALPGDSDSGTGKVTLQRGFFFDLEKQYELQVVVNRGSVAEVLSEKVPLDLSQQIFRDFTRRLMVSQDVDALNQRTCNMPTEFTFVTNQDAKVTLNFKRVRSTNLDGSPNFGSEDKLIDDQLFAAGEHTIPITPSDLLAGDYVFELSGVSEVDGHSEMFEGTATSELTIRDSLPVGHTIIKGVDLYDGHLTLTREDISLPGRGVPITFQRTYSSNGSKEEGLLGLGWSHNWESKIMITPCGEVIVIGGEGSGMRFVSDGAGGLRPLKGYHGTLQADPENGAFDFWSPAGNRWHYRNAGLAKWFLAWVEDPNGNRTELALINVDGELRPEAVRDPGGREIRFNYERRGFNRWSGDVITSVEGPDGLSMTFEYDTFGNLVRAAREEEARVELYEYAEQPGSSFELRQALSAVQDGLSGATTRYTYMSGNLGIVAQLSVNNLFVTSVQEPLGGTTSYVYDLDAIGGMAGRQITTTVTDRVGNETTYLFNRYGSPLEIRDAAGGVTTMVWPDDDVFIEQRTDANGTVMDYTYDADANLTGETVSISGQNFSRDFDYANIPGDPRVIKNRMSRKVDRDGNVTTFEYDDRGNLTRERTTVEKAGGGTEVIETVNVYNAQGDRVSARDGRGGTTTFTYDSYGNLLTTTDPEGNTTTTRRDIRGRVVERIDPRGNSMGVVYDTLDRVIEATHEDGTSDTFTFDDIARVQTQTDVLGRTTTSRLDLEGQIVRMDNALGGSKVFEYDLAGNKTLESEWFDADTPRFDISFTYDELNRVDRRTEPEGRVTTYAYDGVGNVVTETLSGPGMAPRVTEFEYDEENRRTVLRRLTEGGSVETRFFYDGEGNRIREVDPLGRETTFRFDALDRLIERVEPLGRRIRLDYDANGNLIREEVRNDVAGASGDQIRSLEYDGADREVKRVDAEGNANTTAYDPVGNMILEVDARGTRLTHTYDSRNRRTQSSLQLDDRSITTRLEYDAAGNVVRLTQPNGNVIENTFDDANRVIRTVDSLGELATFEYDARGKRIRVTDAKGLATVSSYDGLGQLLGQELPEGRTIALTYDAVGNKLSETDPEGGTTRFEYDLLNRLVRTTDPAPLSSVTTNRYDAVGNIVEQTDPNGHTTMLIYDDLDRVIEAIGPAPSALRVRKTYDRVGNVLTQEDRRGIVTEFRYDRENRPLEQKRNGLTLVENIYDEVGNRITLFDANRNRTDFEYDRRNLLIVERAPLGAVTRRTLDAMGDPLEITDPEGRTTTTTYDVRRRASTVANGAGDTTTFGYDANGNRTSLQRAEGGDWAFTFDDADRLLMVTNPEGDATTYEYDRNGNRTAEIDARSLRKRLEYDAIDRLTAIEYPDGAREELSYDANSNRTRLRDALGQEVVSTFDELNREATRTFPGDGLSSLAFTYDENDNILSVTETFAGGSTTVTNQTWDAFDRLASVTDRFGNTLSYGYDANGNRIQLTDPDGLNTLYGYDALNRIQSVTLPSVGPSTYEWLRNGQLSKITYPNGVSADYSYDAANRLASIDNLLGATTLSSYAYGYDKNGNRVRQTETNGGAAEETTYDFDSADRLTQVVYADETVDYTYDRVGNRLSEIGTDTGGTVTANKAYAYNDRNQLAGLTDNLDASASVTYTYDANGNQIRRQLAGGGVTDFTYDVRDQLVEVTQDSIQVGAYGYDWKGLRITKSVAGGDPLRYVYDQKSVLLQTDISGSTVAKYDYGPDRLLSMNHVVDGRGYYLFDALGSVVNLVAQDGGLRSRSKWDAWGNIRGGFENSQNPFGFTGHEMDPATGLIYFKARFYDPALGRFLSEDAFDGRPDDPPSLHKYLYAKANPTVFVDPDGNIALFKNFRDRIREGKQAILGLADSFSETDFAKTGLGKVVGVGVGVGVGALGFAAELGATAVGAVNLATNVAVLTLNTDEQLAQEAAAEIDATIESVKDTINVIKEDPVGVGTKIVKGAAETLGKALQGDPRAIADTTSTVLDLAVGAKGVGGAAKGVAKGTKKVAEVAANAGRKAKEVVKDAATAVKKSNKARRSAAKAKMAPAAKAPSPKPKGKQASPSMCFVAGTAIATPHGQRAIEEIQAGDIVWARDETTGQTRPMPVVELFVTPDQVVWEVAVRAADGRLEILGTTEEHPFWVADKGWVAAGRLAPGDQLAGLGGEGLEVERVTRTERRETVYNFEVAEVHTYFAGELGTFVHNMCKDTTGGNKQTVRERVESNIAASKAARQSSNFQKFTTRQRVLANIAESKRARLAGRTAALRQGTGVNITPRSSANRFRAIGRGNRTFVTDLKAVEDVIGPLTGNRIKISAAQASKLETDLGLNPNSLERINIISIVDDIKLRDPRAPTSGNALFLGEGKGLPGGGPEFTIQGIPTAGGPGIRQIILEIDR